MTLESLTKLNGTKKSKKRVGRGIGSGKGGHTTGRGHKGQKARTGYNLPIGFEGGQVPLYKKLPQLGGFKRSFGIKVIPVSLSRFEIFDNGTKVTPEVLVDAGIVKRLEKRTRIKILANGSLSKKLELSGFILSESAQKKLEKSGSKIVDSQEVANQE